MKRLVGLVALTLVAAVLPVVSVFAPTADAQAILVDPTTQAVATEIVNGSVTSTQSVLLDGEPHLVNVVAIDTTIVGSASGSILVEVPGGTLADGTPVNVSHQPEFEAGDEVQLALVTTPPSEGSLLATAVGSSQPVFSVVGGLDGTRWLSDGGGHAHGANDYNLMGTQWEDFVPAVPFKVNASGSGISDAATISAVKRAFQTWENDAGSLMDFTYAGTSSIVQPNLGDGVNNISWVTTPNGADTWLAQALWFTDGQGNVLGFDIKFNRDYAWADGAQGGRYDIGSVGAHEVGHAIGLGHVGAASEIMYYSVSPGGIKPLGPGDRSGAAYLYPAPPGDPGRLAAAGEIVDALEAFAEANGTYRVSGGGANGTGNGWFLKDTGSYPESIANVLANQGYFPDGIPTDPAGRRFFIRRCGDRIAVFSNTDTATTAPNADNWWTNRSCKNPLNTNYTHLTLSAPLPTDSDRLAAAGEIVDALEAFAEANGTYRVSGGGANGTGNGWFLKDTGSYPESIANVLANQGYFPDGIPTDPAGRRFFIRRCGDRIGVFSNTDTATTAPYADDWWTNRSCKNPLNTNYTHLTLSARLP